PLLHEDVERLADGRPADLEPLAERVLGGDALALTAQILTDRVGDLEVPRNPRTVVHADPPAVRMSRHLTPRPHGVNDADGREPTGRTPFPRGNGDRKSTRLNSSHYQPARMPSSA